MERSLGLPRGVVATFTEEEIPDDELFCEELAISKGYDQRRMLDFKRGRYCAHKCLGYYDINQAIGKDCDGVPVWPEGLTGSISHCPGLGGAIAARRTDYLSVGLDVELMGRVTSDLWHVLFTDSEIKQIHERPDFKQSEFSTQLYSLKEAYYKMQFPLTRSGMESHDLEILAVEGQFEFIDKRGLMRPFETYTSQAYFKVLNNYVISYLLLSKSRVEILT